MKNTISLLLLAFCTFATSYSSNNETKINNNLYKTTSEGTPFFRVGFDAPKIDHRQLLIGIEESTTVGLDWGYDSELYEVLADDMYWYIEETKCVIQGYPTAVIDTEIPLGIIMSDTGDITIGIDEVINPIENIVVYLKDKELNTLYNIQDSTYQTTLAQGEYNARFVFTFKSSDFVNGTTTEEDVTETSEDTTATTEEEITTEDSSTNESAEETETTDNNTTNEDNASEEENSTEETVSTEDENIEIVKPKIKVHYNKNKSAIILKNENELDISKGKLFNKRGLNIKNWKVNSTSTKVTLSTNGLKRGLYYILVKTDYKVFKKKFVVKS